MTVYTYFSTDTGIPTMRGQAGARIALYDAVLVNGFNAQTGVTITRTLQVATATKTAHGYRNDQRITVSGASQSEYNGVFTIFNVTANTFDFTVTGSPTTPATGAPASIVAPAGWSKVYSGTNKAVYRAATGNRLYYRIDDSGTTTARLIGYETMSDVDTGTGLFPTTAQLSGGSYLQKSTTANATSRPFVIVSNGTLVYDNCVRDGVAARSMMGFGEFVSRKTGDAYAAFVSGTTASGASGGDPVDNSLVAMSTVQSGLYVARSYTQLGSALTGLRVADERVANSLCGSVGYIFPNQVDGGLDIAQIRLFESTTLHRGWLPGLYNPMHPKPLTDGDIFTGTGSYSGRKFLVVDVGASGNGQIFIEISDTW